MNTVVAAWVLMACQIYDCGDPKIITGLTEPQCRRMLEFYEAHLAGRFERDFRQCISPDGQAFSGTDLARNREWTSSTKK
jgi:hypothetical protein